MTPFSLFLYLLAFDAGAGVLGLVLLVLYMALLFVRGIIAQSAEKV